jgi:alpha-L-arabinofuranosidase
VQSDTTAENTMVRAGDPAWSDYDLRVKAMKLAGAEGFLVAFGVKDSGNYYWWNLGGWGNTRSAVEEAVDGGKETLVEHPGGVESGRAYDVRIEVRGRQVTLFLDGERWGAFTDDKVEEPFRQVVTRDGRTGELIVKVVNAQADAARTDVAFAPGFTPAPVARLTTLQGDPETVNTTTSRPIRPRRTSWSGVASRFVYTFPGHSVTFMRVRPG